MLKEALPNATEAAKQGQSCFCDKNFLKRFDLKYVKSGLKPRNDHRIFTSNSSSV